MKKVLALLCVFCIMASLTACGSKANETTQSDNLSETESDGGNFQVNKNLLTVDITVPKEFINDDDSPNSSDSSVTSLVSIIEDGVTKETKNNDGSITYTITKSKHKKMMEDAKKELLKDLPEMTSGHENGFDSIKAIKSNDDFTKFDITVDKDSFENSWDSFALYGVYIYGYLYQVMNGIASDKIDTELNLIDNNTKETYQTLHYPKDLSDSDNNSLT